MTALRTHFIEYLQAQEMSPRTQTVYVRAVHQLAEYYHMSPDQITDEHIRQYLVSLQEQKHLSDGTVMQLLCGLKLFYPQMLTRPWHIQVTSPLHRSKKTWFPPELRQRFVDDLQLQGMSARTQQAYTRVVRLLSEHYNKSPGQITEEELRQYFLHVKNVKKWARATITQSICGITFFFEHTLPRDWTTLHIVRPAKEKRLPVILTVEEVRRILSAIRLLRYRACLTTIYACGLRLKEGTHLQVADIDSPRMLVHVRLGKGGKDRYVPLPQRTLELLRQYWKIHRNPVWLFPATGRGNIGERTATAPMPKPLPIPPLIGEGAREGWPFGLLSKRPVSAKKPPSTPCAIRMPRICSKRA
jgi:site-specific recombinase XerD